MLVYWLDIVGTAVFAISGVLLAGEVRMDPRSASRCSARRYCRRRRDNPRDMALDNGPVFWVKILPRLVVAMVASMLTILLVLVSQTSAEMDVAGTGCGRAGGVRRIGVNKALPR